MLSKVSPVAIAIFSTIIFPSASTNDFFQNIINDPFNHTMHLMVLAGVCVGLPVLIIYLVKKHCEKKRAEQTPP